MYDDDQGEETEMEHDKKTENDEQETRMQSKDSKKGKAADSNGIRAEDIKACDDETKEMVRQIFKEVIK